MAAKKLQVCALFVCPQHGHLPADDRRAGMRTLLPDPDAAGDAAPAGGADAVRWWRELPDRRAANVLKLLKLNVGVPESEQGCPLLSDLVDLDAAVCLCTAIKANVLGININVPVDLSYCHKTCPSDFTCPL